jgi:hypothetical protein
MPDYVAAFKELVLRIRLADPDEPAMPDRLLPFAFKKGLSDDAEIRAMVKTIYAVARSLDKNVLCQCGDGGTRTRSLAC